MITIISHDKINGIKINKTYNIIAESVHTDEDDMIHSLIELLDSEPNLISCDTQGSMNFLTEENNDKESINKT